MRDGLSEDTICLVQYLNFRIRCVVGLLVKWFLLELPLLLVCWLRTS